ncbi:MaoC family dehydratase [Sphingobium sp. AR-3-1]|uniref:MaoC family dehydratase n=1 Tax=Sphingobium psychrophilum TaxID=2728834 RepID=A0A7X9WYA2_9SPHN|nr:MaoC family dehydratase [Sphingobium psychrophilum]NML12151.1 MaoC family dehydratase [Sphingobium psychrophilum]
MEEIVYFEDIAIGDGFDFGPLTVSREETVAFAAEFDPQPFHLSDEAAAQTHFGTLSASGWHTTALFMKMFVAEMQRQPGRQAASLGAMGVDELRWLRPLRPGDTLHGRSEVIDKKASQSRPEMGIVRSKVAILNQDDKPVLTMIPIAMWRTRPV